MRGCLPESPRDVCVSILQHRDYESRGPHPAAQWFSKASEERTLALMLAKWALCHLLTNPQRKGKSGWRNLSKVSGQNSNHKPSPHRPYTITIYHLCTCWANFQRNVRLLPCLTSPTSICCRNGFVSLPLWKRNMFYLYLNILQHKMNDYTISCSLSLLSNTECKICRPRAYHN